MSMENMENTKINFKSPRVLLGIFLGLLTLIVISLVFRPSFITVFFSIWVASNVAKITAPNQVGQLGAGLGMASGVFFFFTGYLGKSEGNSFFETLVWIVISAVLLGVFFALIGYLGAKVVKKYEQGQGPFF